MEHIQTASRFVRKESIMKTIKLFNRDFSMVVIGQIISLFGNAILRFALPLYLLRETNSSVLFGTVTACSFIPMVIFSLLGGVIADRENKRNIMVVLDFFTAFIIIMFYIILGKLPLVPLMIVTLMLLYGISGAYQPSVQASIPLLINSENLVKGNAVINMVSTLSSLLGPAIGGVLFQAFGLTPILIISFACFAAAAIMEIFIHIPHQKIQGQSGIIKTLLYDLKESYQFIKNEKPVYISVVIVLALFNLVLSAAMIVGLPVMVGQILEMSDASVGIAQSALGLGGLVGGILSSAVIQKLNLKDNHILLIICSVCALFMGIALVEMIPEAIGFWIITGMSFVTMCVSTIFTVTLFAAIQRQTPTHLLGKIMAVIIAVSNCSQPIGQALYGIAFDSYKHMPWVIMCVSAVLALFISIYSKRVFVRLAAGEQYVANKNMNE